eukprot:5350800-Pleurochrysis_carterae.AAC.1
MLSTPFLPPGPDLHLPSAAPARLRSSPSAAGCPSPPARRSRRRAARGCRRPGRLPARAHGERES